MKYHRVWWGDAIVLGFCITVGIALALGWL